MKNNDLISVIIPVYNPGRHFIRCLNSIVGQTHQNLEIILVDDGSSDGSEAICDEYAAKDPRIHVIHQENKGVSAARNAGLDIATGDYYHFPDSDDYLDADAYEYLLHLINTHNCDAVNFEHFITFPDHEDAHHYQDDFYGLCNAKETLYKLASGVQFCWNKLFSNKLIITENLRFCEQIVRGEDTLFAATALQNADAVWFDSRPLYHYVQSEQSACRGNFRPSQLSVLKLYDAFLPIYGKNPEIWQQFVIFTQQVLINLYYDIWSDEKPWHKEKKELKDAIKLHYKQIKSGRYPISKKQKIKFVFFVISPALFCRFHKIIHKL